MIGRLSQASHEGKKGGAQQSCSVDKSTFLGGLCCHSLKPCTGEAAQSCASSPIPHIDSLKLNWKLFCKKSRHFGPENEVSLTFFFGQETQETTNEPSTSRSRQRWIAVHHQCSTSSQGP